MVALATITIWELAWPAHHGRITVVGSVESFVRETVVRVIHRPMTPEIAAQSVRLGERFSQDPADRLTAARAIRRPKVGETVW